MKRSKKISDETIKNILVWIIFGAIAFLLFASFVGFATALGIIFFIPLFLPFVFLIIGTRKNPKPVSFVNASRRPGRGGSSSLWGDDRPLFGSCFDDDSSSSSHSDSFPSRSCFDDDSSTISSSNDLAHDLLYDPAYSSLECNIYHHHDN